MTTTETITPAQETPKADAAATQETKETVLTPKAEAPKVETKETPAAPVVPEKYDLKLADGSLLNAAHVEGLAAFAKEKKLTQEMAQSVLDREHKAVATFVEKQQQELAQKPETWLNDAKADKEIGGEGFGENTELAKRVLAKFGSDTFKKVLNETGLGNHPELLRVFVRIGKAMSEDTLVLPGKHAGGERRLEDIFYGESKTA